MTYYLLFIIINYLIGSIPFALVIGKTFYHVDVREGGSHNLGATNTGRLLGKKAAYLVALFDALKSTIPFLIERQFDNDAALLASLACLVGHCWPIWANFKGGKTVSTSFGLLLGFGFYGLKEMMLLFIFPLFVWIVLVNTTHLVSLSSIITIAIPPILCALFINNGRLLMILILMAALVIIRHKDNIKRLLAHAESKVYLN